MFDHTWRRNKAPKSFLIQMVPLDTCRVVASCVYEQMWDTDATFNVRPQSLRSAKQNVSASDRDQPKETRDLHYRKPCLMPENTTDQYIETQLANNKVSSQI